MKIWKCMSCGNIVTVLKEGTCIPNCCGKEMVELKANTVDAAVEKHVPVVEVDGRDVTVTCGEVLHPMEEKHYIEFMILETSQGVQIAYLKPGEEPICHFSLAEKEEVKKAYAYCNLHGLWVSK
ncbi:MAG: desulfoferrodoxin Dfx [Bacilli bacterium]|nr:desulfoferrodoxin Dfx [Bacilli bacterium]